MKAPSLSLWVSIPPKSHVYAQMGTCVCYFALPFSSLTAEVIPVLDLSPGPVSPVLCLDIELEETESVH